MAQRLVTHAARNSRGNIIAIGNPDSEWRQRRSEWAISDILAGRHEYVVPGTRGLPRPIDVVNGRFGRYLRTRADTTEDNNLDNLPALDIEPWEVAHDNAEVLAVHAALVTHGAQGQALLFGGNEHDPSNAQSGDIHNTRIYDVANNLIIAVESPPADVFCCDHAFLGDGRLLVGGGTDPGLAFPPRPDEDDEGEPEEDDEDEPDEEPGGHFGLPHWSGARECAVYNVDGTWTPAASMRPEPGQETRGGGRWYPTLLTLPDGRILAVGGHPRVDPDDLAVTDSRHGAWLPEVYDPDADAWTYQPGHWLYVVWDQAGTPPQGQTEPTSTTGRNNYLYYPRLFVVPDGRVFMASRNDGRCGWYDPATGLVDEQTIAPPPHLGNARFRETNHTAVLLPLLPGDGYTPRVLFFGMAGTHLITLDSETTEPSWQPTAPRDWASNQPPITPAGECSLRPSRDWAEAPPLRRHGYATILPTGDVLFTGGIDSTEPDRSPDCDGVLEAELYHPGFDWEAGTIDLEQEEWTTTPPGSVVRNYHSVALLLPNGRVLTAGGNIDGQFGGDGVKERRIEIFCPAYDGDPNRPVLSHAPSVLTYGQTFQFLINRAHRVQRVALLRCGSATHAWNGDQRYVGLEFENTATGVIEAVAPPDGNIAPPGPYMLWAVDDRDRPCRLAPFAILS
jgi:hypothetical protein